MARWAVCHLRARALVCPRSTPAMNTSTQGKSFAKKVGAYVPISRQLCLGQCCRNWKPKLFQVIEVVHRALMPNLSQGQQPRMPIRERVLRCREIRELCEARWCDWALSWGQGLFLPLPPNSHVVLICSAGPPPALSFAGAPA